MENSQSLHPHKSRNILLLNTFLFLSYFLIEYIFQKKRLSEMEGWLLIVIPVHSLILLILVIINLMKKDTAWKAYFLSVAIGAVAFGVVFIMILSNIRMC